MRDRVFFQNFVAYIYRFVIHKNNYVSGIKEIHNKIKIMKEHVERFKHKI